MMYDQKHGIAKDYQLGLHWAAATGNVGLIKFALDNGAPIDSAANGLLPLQLACINDNNLAAVQYLIDRNAKVNEQRWSKKCVSDKTQAVAGATGSTALHVACANGCIKVVHLLLRNGAKVDVKDMYGTTPYMIAIAKQHFEIAKVLEKYGAHQSDGGQKNAVSKNGKGDQPSIPERRSLDAPSYYRRPSLGTATTTNRCRRPSLPSILEHRQYPLDIPPLETMPSIKPHPTTSNSSPSRATVNGGEAAKVPSLVESGSTLVSNDPSRSFNETCEGRAGCTPSTPIAKSIAQQHPIHMWNNNQPADSLADWHSHGAVNPESDESYLMSLERRAYAESPVDDGSYLTAYSTSAIPGIDQAESKGRSAVDLFRPSMPAIEHLYNTLNETSPDAASTNAPTQCIVPDPSAPTSMNYGLNYDAIPTGHAKDTKKGWWNSLQGRKSVDVVHSRGSDYSERAVEFMPPILRHSADGHISLNNNACKTDDRSFFSRLISGLGSR